MSDRSSLGERVAGVCPTRPPPASLAALAALVALGAAGGASAGTVERIDREGLRRVEVGAGAVVVEPRRPCLATVGGRVCPERGRFEVGSIDQGARFVALVGVEAGADGRLVRSLDALGVAHRWYAAGVMQLGGPAAAAGQVGSLDGVMWGTPMPAALKAGPGLGRAPAARGRLAVAVTPADPAGAALLGARLRASGGEGGIYREGVDAWLLWWPAAQLPALLDDPAVLAVEALVAPEAHHDRTLPLIGVDLLRDPTLVEAPIDGLGARIGVVDTGLDRDHEAFSGVTLCGFDQVGSDPWADASPGHGTHVSATMVGRAVDDGRYRGIAYAAGTSEAPVFSCRALPASAFGNEVYGCQDDLAADGCGGGAPWVVNFSLGRQPTELTPGSGSDIDSREADDHVWNDGDPRQLYVNSSGNGYDTNYDGFQETFGPETLTNPGPAKNIVTVGSVRDTPGTTLLELSFFSSQGPTADGRVKPDLVAPGESVTSALAQSGDGYVSYEGTSMAAPHVSGVAGLLMATHLAESAHRVVSAKALLLATAGRVSDFYTPAGEDEDPAARFAYGQGVLRPAPLLAPRGWGEWTLWSGESCPNCQSPDAPAAASLTLPEGLHRVVVLMTWLEPAIGANAAEAAYNDWDLSVTLGDGSVWDASSPVETVEVVSVEDPPGGTLQWRQVFRETTGEERFPWAVAVFMDPGPGNLHAGMGEVPEVVSSGEAFDVSIDLSCSGPGAAAAVRGRMVGERVGVEGYSVALRDGRVVEYDSAGWQTFGAVFPGAPREIVYHLRGGKAGRGTLEVEVIEEITGDETLHTVDVTIEATPTPVPTPTAPPTPTRAPTPTPPPTPVPTADPSPEATPTPDDACGGCHTSDPAVPAGDLAPLVAGAALLVFRLPRRVRAR